MRRQKSIRGAYRGASVIKIMSTRQLQGINRANDFVIDTEISILNVCLVVVGNRISKPRAGTRFGYRMCILISRMVESRIARLLVPRDI
jgi:hypothetical protein